MAMAPRSLSPQFMWKIPSVFFVLYSTSSDSPLHFLYFKLILSFCYSCTTTIYQSDWFFHCGDFFLLYGYMIIMSFKKYTSVNVYYLRWTTNVKVEKFMNKEFLIQKYLLLLQSMFSICPILQIVTNFVSEKL